LELLSSFLELLHLLLLFLVKIFFIVIVLVFL